MLSFIGGGERRWRGWFWVTMQLVIMVTWMVMIGLGERLLPESIAVRYAIEIVGLAIALAGVVLAVLGGYHLGRNLTPLPEPRAGARMVTHGIYAHIRHPIYGGILLLMIGLTIAFAVPLSLVALALSMVFFYAKSVHEEERMRNRFPDYARYAASTRRFIPWIW